MSKVKTSAKSRSRIINLNGEPFFYVPSSEGYMKCYDCNEVSDIISMKDNKCPSCSFLKH